MSEEMSRVAWSYVATPPPVEGYETKYSLTIAHEWPRNAVLRCELTKEGDTHMLFQWNGGACVLAASVRAALQKACEQENGVCDMKLDCFCPNSEKGNQKLSFLVPIDEMKALLEQLSC